MSITDLVNWGNKNKCTALLHTCTENVSLSEHSIYQQCAIKLLSCQKGWTKSLKANCGQLETKPSVIPFFPVPSFPFFNHTVSQCLRGKALWCSLSWRCRQKNLALRGCREEMRIEHKQLQANDTLQSTQYLELYTYIQHKQFNLKNSLSNIIRSVGTHR